MITIEWKKDQPVLRDPSDVENYRLNWAFWLNGETLQSVTVSANSDLVATVVTTAATYADIQVSGGTAGTEGGVTVTATSSSGRVQQRTLLFRTGEL